jgi:hypothetical protein
MGPIAFLCLRTMAFGKVPGTVPKARFNFELLRAVTLNCIDVTKMLNVC